LRPGGPCYASGPGWSRRTCRARRAIRTGRTRYSRSPHRTGCSCRTHGAGCTVRTRHPGWSSNPGGSIRAGSPGGACNPLWPGGPCYASGPGRSRRTCRARRTIGPCRAGYSRSPHRTGCACWTRQPGRTVRTRRPGWSDSPSRAFLRQQGPVTRAQARGVVEIAGLKTVIAGAATGDGVADIIGRPGTEGALILDTRWAGWAGRTRKASRATRPRGTGRPRGAGQALQPHRANGTAGACGPHGPGRSHRTRGADGGARRTGSEFTGAGVVTGHAAIGGGIGQVGQEDLSIFLDTESIERPDRILYHKAIARRGNRVDVRRTDGGGAQG
jgi:hypothetical protein